MHSHPPTEPSCSGAFLGPDLDQGRALPGGGGAAEANVPCPVDAVQHGTYLFSCQQQNCKGPHAGSKVFTDTLCLGLLQGSDILKGIFQASRASLEPSCISQSGQT